MPSTHVPVVDVGLADGRPARPDAGVVDHQGRRAAEPVLRRPSASWATSSSRATSHRIAQCLPACGDDAVSRCRAAVSSMSLQTTLPPRWASSTANAAPIPLPAPVMTAAALWLRFSTNRRCPWRSSRLTVDGVVAERFCDESGDVPHGGRRLWCEPGQRLEDVHLVGPDLQLGSRRRRRRCRRPVSLRRRPASRRRPPG